MEFYNVYNTKYAEIASRDEIYPMFKVDLLDHYENTLNDITGYLSSENSGSISVNYQQGVRRTCSFTLVDTEGEFIPSVDAPIWLNRKFKLYIGLQDIYTGDIYWFSQGVFCVTNPSIDRETNSITLEGVDKYGFLGSETGYNQITVAHVIKENTPIPEAIKDTLMLDLGNGMVIDAIPPLIDVSLLDQKFPYEMEKAPASYLADVFIEMGNVMGSDTYYDTDGHMRFDNGTLDMSYGSADSIWDFHENSSEYLEPKLTLNTVDIINSVTIVGNNSDNTVTYTYTAENHNPISKVSIENIGRKAYYEESTSVYNNDRAKDYAEYTLNQKSIMQETMDFSCPLLPHLDVNRVITVTDDYYKFNKQRFIIQSLTIPLDTSSKMTITASNISSLPYYEFKEGSIKDTASGSGSGGSSTGGGSSGGSSGSGGSGSSGGK